MKYTKKATFNFHSLNHQGTTENKESTQDKKIGKNIMAFLNVLSNTYFTLDNTESLNEEQLAVEKEIYQNGLDIEVKAFLFQKVIESLRKLPKIRSLREITLIYKYLEKTDLVNKIFKDNFDKSYISKFLYLCSYHMRYSKFDSNQYVFYKG
jgi:hypothetical protein